MKQDEIYPYLMYKVPNLQERVIITDLLESVSGIHRVNFHGAEIQVRYSLTALAKEKIDDLLFQHGFYKSARHKEELLRRFHLLITKGGRVSGRPNLECHDLN